MPEDRRLLRAKTGFLVADGSRQVIKGGQLVPADHRVVKGREHLFEPADTGVERATRAPGELRVTPRRPDVTIAGAGDTRQPLAKKAPAKKASR